MSVTLIQQNFTENIYLELIDNENVSTGYMSECVSIIFFCEHNIAYGIHCGGGIDQDRVQQILKLFTETNAICNNLKIIYGFSYADFSDYNREILNSDVLPLLKGYCIDILCASNIEFNSNGIIVSKDNFQWQQ